MSSGADERWWWPKPRSWQRGQTEACDAVEAGGFHGRMGRGLLHSVQDGPPSSVWFGENPVTLSVLVEFRHWKRHSIIPVQTNNLN